MHETSNQAAWCDLANVQHSLVEVLHGSQLPEHYKSMQIVQVVINKKHSLTLALLRLDLGWLRDTRTSFHICLT